MRRPKKLRRQSRLRKQSERKQLVKRRRRVLPNGSLRRRRVSVRNLTRRRKRKTMVQKKTMKKKVKTKRNKRRAEKSHIIFGLSNQERIRTVVMELQFAQTCKISKVMWVTPEVVGEPTFCSGTSTGHCSSTDGSSTCVYTGF